MPRSGEVVGLQYTEKGVRGKVGMRRHIAVSRMRMDLADGISRLSCFSLPPLSSAQTERRKIDGLWKKWLSAYSSVKKKPDALSFSFFWTQISFPPPSLSACELLVSMAYRIKVWRPLYGVMMECRILIANEQVCDWTEKVYFLKSL